MNAPTAPKLILDGFPPDLFNFESRAETGGIGGSSAPGQRSAIVHLSGITKALELEFGWRKEREAMPDMIRQAFMTLGTAFEWAVAYAYARRHPNRYIHQPPEMICDGIAGHIDLLDIADLRGLVVDDVKVKWSSSSKDITGDLYKEAWVRVKGYCKFVGATIGRLHIVHVNGEGFGKRVDGTPKQFGPVYRVWEWEWTEKEIAQNWQMILNHKHLATPEG